VLDDFGGLLYSYFSAWIRLVEYFHHITTCALIVGSVVSSRVWL
jgi:hypothetical protein